MIICTLWFDVHLFADVAAGRAQMELLRALILNNANYSARVPPVEHSSDGIVVKMHFAVNQLLAIVRFERFLSNHRAQYCISGWE